MARRSAVWVQPREYKVVGAALAATSDQEALEGYKDHGLFTRVLADGLGGEAAMKGIVSNFSLADYVGAEVPPLAANIYKHDQTPTVSANGQRFSIAEIK